jgi:peptide deformylase
MHLIHRTKTFRRSIMQHSPGVGIAAVAIVFWIFVAVVSVAGMIQDYRKPSAAG